MKKLSSSTKAFLTFALVITLLCGIIVLCVVHFGSPDTPEATEPATLPAQNAQNWTEDTAPQQEATEPATEPTSEVESQGNPQPETNPDGSLAEIDYSDREVLPGDPEYIDWSPYGDPFWSREGKSYCNDKIVSIDIPVECTGETLNFEFGYVTNQCNKYLYINPHCKQATDSRKFGYYFDAVHRCVCDSHDWYQAGDERRENGVDLFLGRTFDKYSPAQYIGPTHPGTIWYSVDGITGQTWVDIRVIDMEAEQMVALIRLIIEKGSDSYYHLVEAQNRNLVQTKGDELMTPWAVETVIHNAMDILKSGEIGYLGMWENIIPDRFLVEHRTEETGLYFSELRPMWGQVTYERDMTYPIIAVTFRTALNGGSGPITIYFRVDEAPTENYPGTFTPVGYDFLCPTSEDLIMDTIHW